MFVGASSPPSTLNTSPYQVTAAPVDLSSPEWCLSAEELQNDEIRTDFFYDHVSRVNR